MKGLIDMNDWEVGTDVIVKSRKGQAIGRVERLTDRLAYVSVDGTTRRYRRADGSQFGAMGTSLSWVSGRLQDCDAAEIEKANQRQRVRTLLKDLDDCIGKLTVQQCARVERALETFVLDAGEEVSASE